MHTGAAVLSSLPLQGLAYVLRGHHWRSMIMEQERACCGRRHEARRRRRRRRRRPQPLAPLLVGLLVVVLMAPPGQAFLLPSGLTCRRATQSSSPCRRHRSMATDGRGSTGSFSSSSSLERGARDDGEEAVADDAVSSMALWELLRELEKLDVVYSVLQPREELTRLLLDARRSSSSGAAAAVKEKEKQEGETSPVALTPPQSASDGATAVAAVDDEDAAPRQPSAAPSPPPPAGSSSRRRQRRPSPSPSSVPPPAFGSIADALAWAGKLSAEEIEVELEFMGVSYDGIDDEPTHSQLARLLARATMREAGGGGAEGAGAGSGARAPPSALPQPKSRARQQRLLREMQQQGGGGRPPVSSSSSSSSRRRQQDPGAYGGEERLLDVDQAREELVAMRDRALSAFGGLLGGNEGEVEKSGIFETGGASGRRKGARSGRKDKARRYDARGESLGLRVFEKATRVADRALDWATRAKSMARGAMIAATTTGEDVDPSGKGKGKGKADLAALKKAELQRRSQAMLGSRGRRWSKLGGVMARAWAESVWQVVMASASWAGGGLLPGKYVLLGAGAFALLLRQGLGAYLATLLVVRTCSSTLRNIIEDEDAPVESF